jgi:hypothetical protein
VTVSFDICWSTDYWLRNCEGFRVTTEDGETGCVDAVDLTPQGDAEALVLRFGREFTHSVRVPAAAVEALDPVDETIVLGPISDRRRRHASRQLRIPLPL